LGTIIIIKSNYPLNQYTIIIIILLIIEFNNKKYIINNICLTHETNILNY